jgi:hypothetical protein
MPLALSLAAGAVVLLGVAQSVPASAPVPPVSAPAVCPIDVMAVVPLPGNGITTSFAAVLASPRGGGTASGTLWVNTSMGPFHVPFAQRMVIGAPYASGDDPIVFALPAAASVQNAFVDSLAGAPPCERPGAWAPPLTPMLDDKVKRALADAVKAANTASPASATSIADPQAACHAPDVPAFVLKTQPVYGAPGLQGGTVRVHVHLAPDSSIVSATVEDPNSAVRYYDTRAVAAARGSVYVTATVACRPVESDYVYSAVFR